MSIEVKKLGELTVVEIVGYGRNKSDANVRIFLSRTGTSILNPFLEEELPYKEDHVEKINASLNELKMYFNKNNRPVLTAKQQEDDCLKTIYGYVESSFRGDTAIKEKSKDAVVVSATGFGNIGQDTAFLASLPKEDDFIILRWSGRYNRGWVCWKNDGAGEVKKYVYEADELCEEEFECAKASFGLIKCDFD